MKQTRQTIKKQPWVQNISKVPSGWVNFVLHIIKLLPQRRHWRFGLQSTMGQVTRHCCKGDSGSQMQHLGSCRWGIHSQEFTPASGSCAGSVPPCRDLALQHHSLSVVQPHSDVPPFARLPGNICAAEWKAWNSWNSWTSLVDAA